MANAAPISIQNSTDHTIGWDWENKHVSGSFLDDGISQKSVAISDIIEAGTVLICAGPADLDQAIKNRGTGDSASAPAGIRIVPIGLIESAQVSMNKPLSRIFEIGSKLSYIIPGRTVGGIAINRVLFDGPSLLKAIYAGEVYDDSIDSTSGQKNVRWASEPSTAKGTSGLNVIKKYSAIGSGNIAANLASSFFSQPVGLAFYFQDLSQQTVSEIYFEGCQVSNWNLGISANMNVLTEMINMEFVRCRPINTGFTYNALNPNVLVDRPIIS